jgi:hypothetical protein
VPTAAAQPPRILDQFRAAARACGQPEPWIEPLTSRITAFIVCYGKRHPRQLDAAAREAFLRHVVATRKDLLAALAAARSAMPRACPGEAHAGFYQGPAQRRASFLRRIVEASVSLPGASPGHPGSAFFV